MVRPGYDGLGYVGLGLDLYAFFLGARDCGPDFSDSVAGWPGPVASIIPEAP